MGRAPRDGVHPAGRLRAARVSAAIPPVRRSRSVATWGSTRAACGRPTARWRPPRGAQRRSRCASGHVHARGDHADAERRMAALATAEGAARPALRRSALDRTGQGRLRRHQHGHGAAVARLRRDGGLPGVHRSAPVAIPDRTVGLPRLDPGAYRPVDAGAHGRRDRRTRTAVQVAAGRAGKRRHDPRDGPPAGARRVRGQPGRVPATASAVADVGRRAVADSRRARDRRLRRRIPLGAKAVHV